MTGDISGGFPNQVLSGSIIQGDPLYGTILMPGQPGPQGDTGFGWWMTSSILQSPGNSVVISPVTGRAVQVGDLVQSSNPGSPGAVGRVSTVAMWTAYVEYYGSIRGPAGPKGDIVGVANVKDFGATGDGVTDDRASIQLALNSGEGIVFFPAATYIIGTQLDCPANRTLIGYGATLKKADPSVAANVALLRNYTLAMTPPGVDMQPGGYNGNGSITLLGLTFDGDGAAPGRSSSNMVTFNHAADITVRDCTFLRPRGNHALEFNAIKRGTADSCKFLGYITDPGLAAQSEALQIDCAIQGAVDSGATDGTPSRDIHVTDCVFDTDGVNPSPPVAVGSHAIPGGLDPWYDGVVIDGCVIRSSTYRGIHMISWRNARIVNNQIVMASGANGGITVRGSSHVLLSGCRVSLVEAAAGGPVVVSEGSDHVTVSGCQIAGGNNAINVNTSNKTVVSGNLVYHPHGYAIVYDNADGGVIAGNFIDGPGTTGGSAGAIRMSNSTGPTVGISITGNTVRKHGISGVTEAAAGISSSGTDIWAFANDFLGLANVSTGNAVNTVPNRI